MSAFSPLRASIRLSQSIVHLRSVHIMRAGFYCPSRGYIILLKISGFFLTVSRGKETFPKVKKNIFYKHPIKYFHNKKIFFRNFKTQRISYGFFRTIDGNSFEGTASAVIVGEP